MSCAVGVIAQEQQSQKPTDAMSSSERYKHTVYIRPNEVLKQSQEYKDRAMSMQNGMEQEAKEVENEARRISGESQELEKEKYELQNGGKSKFTSAETRREKLDELNDREAQIKQDYNNVTARQQRLQEKYNSKEQELQMAMWGRMSEAAEMVAQEQGWGAVQIASLYAHPALDITDDVVQAMNKMYQDQQSSKKQAQEQTEAQAAQNTKQQQSAASA